MQLDRRRLVRAGLGLTALTVPSAHANAQSQTTQRTAQRPAALASAATNVADYGVRPDSGRDETERLQHAIDRAAERRTPLHLAAGRYIARSLHLRSGTRLLGAGRATVLQHAGGPALLMAEGVADVSIQDLSVIGGFPMPAGARGLIELRGSAALVLENLNIETSTTGAIALERSGGRISGCRIAGAAKAGIFSLDAEGGLEISHNDISGIGNNGIQVWRSAKGEDGTIVAFNRISKIAARDGGSGENGNGINVFRAGNVLVTSNQISDCAFTAVRANSASNVHIVSNSITRMGEVAIFVEFAFEGAVVQGNLIDRASTGISVTNFDHGGRLAIVSGNVVRNISLRPGPDPKTSGYGIAVEADTAVTGNTIENAPTAGLLIGWGRFCRDVAATGNIIRKCGIGISVTDDTSAGTVLLSGNIITGSANGAIRSTNHGRPTSGDHALAPPPRGRLTLSGNASA